MKKYLLYFYKGYFLYALLFFSTATAQISMSATGSYSQDFNSLISSASSTWTDNSTIPNLYAKRSKVGNSIVADTGNSPSGNLYSYGSLGSTERSLGSLGSGTPGDFAWGMLLKNSSSVSITDIKLSFVGEQWRNSAASGQTVAFYYKISSSLISDLQPAVNTGWTAVTNLDFTSPITGGVAGALNGNAAANRSVKSDISLPSLNLPAGYYILLKWDDPDHSGSDHGLAIDDVTISWSVNTTPKPEPTNFPAGFSCGTTTNSSIPLSWSDAVGTTLPDGYLIKWSSTSYAAVTDPVDGTAEANSAAVQNVAQGAQNFTTTGLSASTVYYFKIWSYTNSGSTIDYKLVGEPQTSCSTVSAPCNFVEDFSNSNAAASYTNNSFAGNNSITWNYTAARDENGDANNSGISGKALMLRRLSDNSKISSSTINSGIGNFSVKLYKGFIGVGLRQVELFVNNVLVGTSIPFDDYTEHVFTVNNINVPGNIIIELRNVTGTQIIIDDIAWTCFTGTPEPNINIEGNGIAILNGDTTPSTTDGTDFGAAIISGTDVEKSFTLQNAGSASLALDNPAVVLLDGSRGFQVSAQPATSPMGAFASQNFKIKFNNAVPGTYVETVMIGSNDPDTPVYTFDVKGVVLTPTITADKNSLSGFTYAFGQGPSSPQDFVVNGTNLGADIVLTASLNWEISTNLSYDGGNNSPWTTLVLPKSSAGAVTNKTIHVRLKDGLAVGLYSGSVTLSSPNAPSKTITLSGEVTAGIRDIKVTGNGSSIVNGSANPSGLNSTLFASQNIGNSQTKIFEIKNIGGAALTLGSISVSGIDAASFAVSEGPAVGTVLNQNQTATFKIIFAPTTIGTKNATAIIVNDDPNDNPYLFAVRGGATYCSSAGEIMIASQDFEISPATPVLSYTVSNFGAILPGSGTGFSTGDSGANSLPKANNLYSEGARGYRIQGADPSAEIPSGVSFTFDPVNTSVYSNISLSFKIAGFSLGSTGNGMDDLNAAQVSTSVDADKLDYVLVEVSPDGGATWYQQAKVVSGALNLAWSFGSAGTTLGSRTYAPDNNLTYFNSTSGSRYSAISITNLPAATNLKVRISAQDNALNESWILDDVRITSTGLVPKVWNGTSWSPSALQPSDKAVLNADYNSGTYGGFKVCQCEVSSGATLTVAPDTEVKITDVLVNNGTIVVQPQGNFIQVTETDSNSGTGTFKTEQNISLSTGRNQYNYIISPVESFNMKDLYKTNRDIDNLPVSAPFVLYHDEASNRFFNSTGVYIKGRGLAVKEPAASFNPTQIKAVFEGKPVNGQFNYPLINSNPGNSNRGYNLTGNPYPSNMDLIRFYQNNSVSGNISSTFYLWDNTSNTQTSQAGDLYGGQAYAQFNAATPAGVGTGTKATGDAGTSPLKKPTRYLSMGQGFMTKLINVSSQNITFSNSTRSANTAQSFFGKDADSLGGKAADRYWLNMINPGNIAANIAIVYSEEGLDGYTKEDSPSMGGSDTIYSSVDGEKVSINGKSSFTITDEVILGTAHFAEGDYTIALEKPEGIFAEGQQVYLKDSQTGIVTDLTQNSYTFYADSGETNGRFEIIYQPETFLATDLSTKEDLVVYRDNGNFIVKARSKKITKIEIFDMNGRLMVKLQTDSTKVAIPSRALMTGVSILKINQGEVVTGRKIIK